MCELKHLKHIAILKSKSSISIRLINQVEVVVSGDAIRKMLR